MRRQASALRGEAAAAHRDEEAVRRSSLSLAEVLGSTVENGKENVSLARERLRCLHAALRRLRGERAKQREAVEAAVAWQESLEELRCEGNGNGAGGGVRVTCTARVGLAQITTVAARSKENHFTGN